MQKKDYLVFVATFGLAMALTGCGCSTGVTNNMPEVNTEAIVEVQTEVKETVYDVREVAMQYLSLAKADTVLSTSPDLKEKVSDVNLHEVVTVTHEVYMDDTHLDIYKVTNSNGVSGFMSGSDLDFNYVDVIVESTEEIAPVEGGDGIESTEVIEEQEIVADEVFESYQMYTNCACNIRSLPSKDGELLGTYPINTQITVVGVSGDWSELSYDGCKAFIKSSLLSKDKTVVTQSSGGSGSTSSSNSSGGSSSSDSSGSSSESSGNSSGGGLSMPDGGGYGGNNNYTPDPIGDGNGDVGDRDIIMH